MTERKHDLEEQRLAALYDYDVLDTEPEETFDRITKLRAARDRKLHGQGFLRR